MRLQIPPLFFCPARQADLVIITSMPSLWLHAVWLILCDIWIQGQNFSNVRNSARMLVLVLNYLGIFLNVCYTTVLLSTIAVTLEVRPFEDITSLIYHETYRPLFFSKGIGAELLLVSIFFNVLPKGKIFCILIVRQMFTAITAITAITDLSLGVVEMQMNNWLCSSPWADATYSTDLTIVWIDTECVQCSMDRMHYQAFLPIKRTVCYVTKIISSTMYLRDYRELRRTGLVS